MKLINKIAILLNGPREIDMYTKIIQLIPKDKIEILISDVNSSEVGRNNINKSLKLILKKKNIEFKNFSSVYKKEKYKVILSSGELTSTRVTLVSFLKYCYSKSLGKFIRFTKLNLVFEKLFNRPLTGAHRDNIGSFWYPEKELGETSVKLPKDLDLKLKVYPPRAFDKAFDVFFTISSFEQSVIRKKFENKKCQVVGYPRYTDLVDKEIVLKKIREEFKVKENKKIIYWTPTFIHYPNEQDHNILLWINKISFLTSSYNIIIRPHPRTLASNPTLEEQLKKLNFFVDTNPDRDLGNMLNASDLIMGDYGGTIFGSLYLNKPIILLNSSSNLQFVNNLINSKSLDIKLREFLIDFDQEISVDDINKKIKYGSTEDYQSIIDTVRSKYFDKLDSNLNNNTKSYLLDYLDN